MGKDKVQMCGGCSTHDHILQSAELPVKEGYIENYYGTVLRDTWCTAAVVRESIGPGGGRRWPGQRIAPPCCRFTISLDPRLGDGNSNNLTP